MFNKLRLRWKLKKLHDEKEDVFRRAMLQNELTPLDTEINNRKLFTTHLALFTTHCTQLILLLRMIHTSIADDKYLEKFKGIHRMPTIVNLSEWFTDGNDNNVIPNDVDATLQDLLTGIAELLVDYEKNQRGDNLSYYKRKTQPIIHEALRVRLELQKLKAV